MVLNLPSWRRNLGNLWSHLQKKKVLARRGPIRDDSPLFSQKRVLMYLLSVRE